MRSLWRFAVSLCFTGLIAGCQSSKPISSQEAAIAEQITQQVNTPKAAAVAASRYRTYRWMTSDEMVRYRLGYDPTMAPATRSAVEQAVDDDLADKGFERGEPADFLAAFSNVYIDRNRAAAGPGFLGAELQLSDSPKGTQVEAYSGMEVYKTPEESFTIVFLDAQTRQLLWRGTGTEKFATEAGQQSNAAIEAAVYQALNNMPVPLAP